SRVGPGAPPCSGPVKAHQAASTAAATVARVEATTRAVNEDPLSPLSAMTVKYVSSAATFSASGVTPCSIRSRSAAVDRDGSGRTGSWPCAARSSAGTATVTVASNTAGLASSVCAASARRMPSNSVRPLATGSHPPSDPAAASRPAPRACFMPARVSPLPANPSHSNATVPSKPWSATNAGRACPRTQTMPLAESVWLSTVSAATTPSSPLCIRRVSLCPFCGTMPGGNRAVSLLDPGGAGCETAGSSFPALRLTPYSAVGGIGFRTAGHHHRGSALPTPKTLTEGQRAYEAKRAAKAGMSLEKWLASKQRQQEADEKARKKVAEAAKPAKPPGFFSRLLERAQRPLGS